LYLLFFRFRSAIAKLVATFYSFRMKVNAAHSKPDLTELRLYMTVINNFAEGQ
jgi:hypothetical protein